MNRHDITILLLSVGLMLPAATGARAQHGQHGQYGQEDRPPAQKFEEEETHPDRKQPGIFFHRPDSESAASQLEHAASLAKQKKLSAAMKQYNALVYRWGESREAPTAQYEYARLLEETGHYAKAFDEYQYLIDFYAGRFPFDDVIERQLKIANYMMTTKKARWFFGGFNDPQRALPMFEKIVENAPNWKGAADAEFRIGVINEEAKEYESASQAYETVRTRHRRSGLADDASFRRAYCLYLSAKTTPRDEVGYRDALSALTMFIRDYPGNTNAAKAQEYLDELKERVAGIYFERALFYDKIAKRPASAVIAYTDFIRNFPASEKAREASRRIDELNSRMEKEE